MTGLGGRATTATRYRGAGGGGGGGKGEGAAEEGGQHAVRLGLHLGFPVCARVLNQHTPPVAASNTAAKHALGPAAMHCAQQSAGEAAGKEGPPSPCE